MNQQQLLRIFPDIEYDEVAILLNLTKDMSNEQQQTFLSVYQNKRKDRTLLLVLALLGFVGIAGVHRLVTGDVGLGVLYLLTGGLCLIGTIVDLINIRKITNDYNVKMAYESANLTIAVFK